MRGHFAVGFRQEAGVGRREGMNHEMHETHEKTEIRREIPADWKKRKALGQRPKCLVVNEWAERAFKPVACAALPSWDQMSDWRGKLVAVCDYEASYNAPNPPIWNEGYPVWWHLTNVCLLDETIPCRGNVGMWRLSDNINEELPCRF